jgi:hypothetical protein
MIFPFSEKLKWKKNYHLPSCVIQEKSKVNQVRGGIDCGAPYSSAVKKTKMKGDRDGQRK